jgi:CHAT domain-containing protein
MSSPRSLDPTIRYLALTSASLIGVACAVAGGAPSDRLYRVHQQVAAIVANERPFQARLSGSQEWVRCDTTRAPATAGPVTCATYEPQTDRLTRAAARVANERRARRSSESDATWAASILDLVAAPGPQQLDAVIARLTGLVEAGPTTPDLRNDLAVAHIVRADLRRDAMSMLLALDQLERARSTDSASSTIEFNRALVLERLHLYELAEGAWRGTLALNPGEDWAAEIRVHIASLAQASSSRPFEDFDTLTARHAFDDPQTAREWVLNVAVGNWARLVRGGDDGAALTLAHTVAVVGAALVSHSGDSSLLHVAQATTKPRPELVDAVFEYDRATADYRRGDFLAAEPRAREASHRLRALGRPGLADWADLLVTGVYVTRSDFRATKALATALEKRARARSDFAVMGRALWLRALAEAREGKAADAIADYTEAGKLYERIGETANNGSMLSQRADVLFLLGRDEAALNLQREALLYFDRHRRPVIRAGPLLALGRQLAEIGLDFAGVVVLREAVLSGARSERAPDLPEALLRLAAAEFAVGSVDRGRHALDRARAALRAVRDTLMRERMEMEIATAEATMAARTDPGLAVRRLDQASDYFRRHRITYDLAGPLTRSANLRLQIGDTTAAEQNLAEAISTIESQSIGNAGRSGSLAIASARRDVYRALASVHLARGELTRAFVVSERARGNRILGVPKLPPAEVAIAYVVYPRETVAWVVRGDSLHTLRLPVSAERLAELTTSLERLTRGGDAASNALDPARALYDALIAPAAAYLENARQLRIIGDAFLGRVPFAGLRRSDGKYLIELVPISYASGLRANASAIAASRRVVIVGNPSFDASLFPELQPLRDAASEASRIRGVYGAALSLEGPLATKSSLVAALPFAGVLHFAGHARLVDRIPSLSHLVVARDSGGFAGNALTAAEIEAMPLERVGLVVLSACGTTQAHTRRDVSESGLARSFLNAGVKAVVSSLWEVDDGGMANLMQRLHERLAAGVPPVAALRDAQVSMIASTHGTASPRFWSAFRLDQN